MSSAIKSAGISVLARKRAMLADKLRKAANGPRQEPLSFAQQRLWFLDQLEPDSPLYNIGAVARVEGAIDVALLEKALNQIVSRHETLRTRFGCPEETPVQIIDPRPEFRLNVVDLRDHAPNDRESEAQRLIQVELNRPFNLSNEHPLRATWIHLQPDQHRLALTLHHIVADEWSLRVLFHELVTLYSGLVAGRAVALPQLPIQYADYARWQRQWLQGGILNQQLQYWKDQLKGYPPATELPTDQPRGATPSFRGGTLSRPLGQALTESLRALAKNRETTLFTVLLATFKALIHRYTQQEDLIVCSPVAGRTRVETEGLIGFFVNTLPLRTSLADDPTFVELLARVRQVTLGAIAHQDLPFDRLVEELQPERSFGHLPFTRLMFAYQTGVPEELELPGARLRFIDADSELAKFELTLVLRETSDGLVAKVEYNRDLFNSQTIVRLLGHLETLLAGAAAKPASRLSELPMLTPIERSQVLFEWNGTTTEYPRDRCINELFEAQAARSPESIAIAWGQQQMSYYELNSRANQLARFLRQFVIKPDVPVGLCVDRSLEMVVGMLGVLKAGGAYVPLDPVYPKERIGFMLEDTQAPVVITQQRLLSRLPKTSAKLVCLDADWELIAREPRENTANLNHARHLAYIMYTSGSTGQPKGVAVPHRAISRLVLNTNYIGLGPSDRIAQVSNISFDAATFELWGALLNGAQLVGITKDVALSPKDFAKELRDKGITAMFLTAALFNQLASEAPGAFETIRTVIAGGEPLDPKWVRAVLRHHPPQRLLNGYGPTENTTFTCCHAIEDLSKSASTVPIGKPISNSTVYILDGHLNPVPIGVPGELYTGGDGLARGYWNRPELTAEKFVHNPFDHVRSSQLYKTGDLARYLPDGTIECLGRIDGQVKIRGYRIELGEIEARLGRHPAVRDCVVSVCGSGTANKRLVAYVVSASDTPPNASELRAFLTDTLPDYMIPSAFVNLPGLPLTPNGKVDRRALPAPDQTRPSLDRQYVPASDTTEQQLVAIWENVLGVHPIGVQDKFFDLGGHSMLAVRVIAQIEKAFGRKLRLATLFQAPTVDQLAAVLREEVKESSVAAGNSLVEIQGAGSRPPLFLVHGAGGGMFWGYVNLARALGTDQPVYGFKSRGLDGHEEFDRIEEMAEQYISDLKSVQPHGPYYLGGYCFGGNVAYEMACQLIERGEQVALLALFNCAPPNSRYSRISWTPRWWLRFARNLIYWAGYFSHWSANQRREFFRWKWHLVRKKLARGHAGRDGLARVEPGDLVDLSSYTQEQKVVWETHIRALMNFHPRPFEGQVHLFRSPGHPLWCSFDEDYGWRDLAQSGVKLITVPGAHEKILEEPWVKALAEQLSATLHRAQGLAPLYASEASATATEVPAPAGRYSELVSSVPESPAEAEALQLDYWKRQLGDLPELLDLPTDHPRPAQGDYVGARCPFEIEGQLGRKIARLAVEERCEPFAILLATLAAVLQRYTGAEDLVIGSVVSLRTPATREVIGPFENRIALRCDLSGEPTFRELIRRCVKTIQQAKEHSAVPFEKVVAALRPQASQSYTPIFQVFLSVEPPLPGESGAAGLRLAPYEIDKQTSRFDLSVWLVATETGYSGRIEYSTSLFDVGRVHRLAEHFTTLLGNATAAADTPVAKLELLSPHETERLLVEWTATEKPYPQNKTLADLFVEQACRSPETEALVDGETRLTYGQLHRDASAVARRLINLGVGTESLVGICFERSTEMIVAMLGTLLSGAAYVPLDPKYPKERLAFTLQDAQIKVLLTQSTLLDSVPQPPCHILCLDSLAELAAEGVTQPYQSVAKPSDLAYVIYTSGSTGKPKGVALEHRNAVAMVCWARDQFTNQELTGVLACTSICFDLSVFEIFVPLCSGGKVILAENALALKNLEAAGEVRLINTVPSAMRELLRLRGVPAGVQVVNLAGEPLSAELVDQIYQETSVRKVYDLYGPSETTTYSTGALRKAGETATIGRPLANEQVYLLDVKLRPVPIGIPGELFIGGAGVARGYLHRPELTGERFIANPFKPGERLYRTGDLARWRADGQLEYLGRIDHQVKIRGFRIELGEVEIALKSHPAVGSALVMAREDIPGDKRLVAYIVARSDTSVTAEALKEKIREQLPEFMVPSDFVFLSVMPMTPNGKIDRKALPSPEPAAANRTDLVAPRTPEEEQVAAIWCDVLRIKQVSVADNFFDLGGHSLLAVRILSAIRDKFKVELPFSAFFSEPTIAGLAAAISSALVRSDRAAMSTITPVSRAEPLPVSFVQERLWFLDQLQPGSPAYNVPTAVRLKGPLQLDALKQSLNVLIARHESLRSTFRYAEQGLFHTIAEGLTIEIPCVDLQSESIQDRQQHARKLINDSARQPFDLSAGPLLRVKVFRLAEDEHILLVVLHHTISDGWSLALLFQELATVYDSVTSGQAEPQLEPLPLQYPDFACWQRNWMKGPVLERELAYWKKALADAPAEIELPVDFARPAELTGRADSQVVQVDTEAASLITDFGRRQGCTAFVVFLTALFITLRRWTGQQEMVVGTVVAGRTRRELENIIGCFMNFLPLRTRLQDAASASELLGRVRALALEAQSHQDCPFEKIVEAVNPHRRLNQNPLYNVALLLQNFPPNLFQSEHLQANTEPVSLQAALLDLRFEIETPAQGGLLFSCEYRTDLFSPGTIRGLLESWVQVIDKLVKAPGCAIADFALISGLTPKPASVVASATQPTIAIASTFTAEPVAESLQHWLQQIDISAAIEFAPYDQVFQQLLDPGSLFGANRSGLNIVLARLEDWQAAQPGRNHSSAQEPDLQRITGEFFGAIKAAAGRSSVPFLVCLCPSSSAMAKAGFAERVVQAQHQLEQELASVSGVYVLSSEELARWYPVADYEDAAAEELGRVPYSPVFFTALGTALARKFHALNRAPFKVIALDCDNTLWSGVCGEEGAKGIQVEGPWRELQQFMRLQRDSGMLLCLCSKNNEADVQAVFEQRNEMALRLADFAATRLNWEPKSANLKSLAAELALGLDSFIFLDDNPVECAEVRANCPGVLTLQLPEDPAWIPQFLQHCWAFDHLKLTAEDRQRAELYDANRQREKLRAETPTLEEFLASLELKIDIESIGSTDLPRVSQLTQRTNQFNFTTRRRTEQELGVWLSSADGLSVRVSDRFGDYGLVGTILYQENDQTLVVDTFLLSCRVLGRGVEHRMLACLGEIARERGAHWIDLHFVPSAKNKPALDFLEQAAGAFKQPQNGGSVFRLPVELAAVSPAQRTSEPAKTLAARQPELSGDPERLGLGSNSGFTRWREIALEANDVHKIHQVIRNGTAVRKRGTGNYLAPSSELERKLCVLWQDLLHVAPIGVRDDFFELGGHSLLAVRLFAEIQKITGRRLPLVTLFQAPTIERLARVLASEDSFSLLVPIQPNGDKTPLFLVHGAGGDVLWGYANLAAHLPQDQPVYGIKSPQQGLGDPHAPLEQMARGYLEVIKARQPQGPYYLGGYCFGGNVAYEMARQLRLQGQEVGLVILIDAAPCNAGYETVTWWRPGFVWRFARNLRIWLADFMDLKAEDRRRFFGRKLRCLGRKLQRRLGLGCPKNGFDLEQIIDLRHFPERELKLWQAHLEALVAHIERPYAGRVALIRTRGQALFCSLEEDFCWGKLVRGQVTVRCIPGSHENIFMEPNVCVLASELAQLLEQGAPSAADPTEMASAGKPSEPLAHV